MKVYNKAIRTSSYTKNRWLLVLNMGRTRGLFISGNNQMAFYYKNIAIYLR